MSLGDMAKRFLQEKLQEQQSNNPSQYQQMPLPSQDYFDENQPAQHSGLMNGLAGGVVGGLEGAAIGEAIVHHQDQQLNQQQAFQLNEMDQQFVGEQPMQNDMAMQSNEIASGAEKGWTNSDSGGDAGSW